MKKSFLVFVSLIFAFQQSIAAQPVDKPMFFEISKNGQTAYMLGTMHVDIQLEALPSYVTLQLQNANTVVIETDLEKAIPLVTELQTKPSATPLSSYLSNDQWIKLSTALEQTGLSQEQILGLYPALAMNQYVQAELSKLALRQTLPPFLDGAVAQYALDNGKLLDYLDPVDVQINIIKSIYEDATQLKDVLNLNTPQEIMTYVTDFQNKELATQKTMFELFYAGDEVALYKLMEVNLAAALKETLLDVRNKNWIPVINKIMANQGTEFIAFGAGHLAGSNGVIELLVKDGYTVKRVTQ
jgi:uncharacterized protein